MRTIKISNRIKKLINNLFSCKTGFTSVAINRNSHEDKGEVRMWCNVIKSGFLTLDYNFILSGPCKTICDSLLLEYDYVVAAFLKIEGLIFEEFKR